VNRRLTPSGTGLVLLGLLVAARSGSGSSLGEEGRALSVAGSGRLAVAVTRHQEIVVLRPTGEQLHALDPPGAGLLIAIAWSPDGRRIAFTRWLTPQGRRDETDIFVADADGSNVRRLTHSKQADDPVWSPDGETIVFSQDEGPPASEFTGLWTVDADGGEPRELIPAEPRRVDVPSSFSPDGRTLAFTRVVAPDAGTAGRLPATPAVYLLDVASGEERLLAEHSAEAAFSPDGRRIAFVSVRDRLGERVVEERQRYGNELYVMDADGGNVRRLTRTLNLTERAPSWSPDRRLLAYERTRIFDFRTMVMTIRPDGRCPRPLAFDPGWGVWYGTPAWRPGGRARASELRCRPAPTRATPWPVPVGGNVTLEEARRYRALAIYWLGRSYRRALLSHMFLDRRRRVPRGPGPSVTLMYGEVQLQLYHVCVRVPADIALVPDGRIRLRGRQAVLFEGGTRLELVTGNTTIVVFGPRRLLPRVVRDLRPLNPPVARAGRALPAPVRGARFGVVRCP
jgi:hypothetical protein